MQRLKYWLGFTRYVVGHYFADDCNHRAAALTYTSLFAVVPLITVMYTVLSFVPYYQNLSTDIETLIFAHLLPSSGQEVQSYIHHFSQQARKLTGVGVLFLAVTAWLMLQSIEESFNLIWKSAQNRRRFKSFAMHWIILSLGPLFLGAAILLSTYLMSIEIISDHKGLFLSIPSPLQLTPYLLTALAFTLLYSVVPNWPVPFKHACLGGVMATVGFEVARALFTQLMGFTSIELIYGTFAAIPLFLIWIYTSWVIVLIGAEFVHALQSYPHHRSL